MVLELASWPLAMVIAFALTDAFELVIAPALLAPVFAGTYALLALDLIRRTDSGKLAKVIGTSIGIAVALSFTLSVAVLPSASSALLSVTAGTLLLVWGAGGRQLGTLIAGLITAGAGLLFGFDALVRLVITSSWIDLAIFGAGAIALGSILDRHGIAIKLRLTRWYENANRDREEIALDSHQLR